MSELAETITFGCRLNSHESDVMQRNALAAGLRNAVIINTCAVTSEAERQARQAIRRLRRERPGVTILVTGCASTIDEAGFSAMDEVDGLIPNDRKLEGDVFAPFLVPGVQQSPASTTPHDRISSLSERRAGRAVHRAFIAIQNGCDHRCTFCIIPFGRGPSRSQAIGAIAEEVRKAVENGFEEVVFTGVDIASYGCDLPGTPRLGQMVRRVLALVPALKQLRLSSLDPAAIDDEFWRLLCDEPRLMPHLHLSLQAGDDVILKRMKRRHSREDVLKLCARARVARPDITFGADLIAGFPTETDAMFAHGCDLIEQCGITWLHVFPYSPRKGTPAAKMPQVHGAVRKARADILRGIGRRAAQEHLDRLAGKSLDVLIENPGVGCTPHFAKVPLEGVFPVGEIVPVSFFKRPDGSVVGRPL